MSAVLPGGPLDRPAPLFDALDDHDANVRRLEPFIAAGFTDAEAWEALFDDAQRLDRYRAVYGNRKGKRARR